MTFASAGGEIEGIIEQYGPSGVPVGYAGHQNGLVAPSIDLNIIHGEAIQKSFGAPGSNLVRYPGVAIFTIYTAGGIGSVAAEGYAETIKVAYQNRLITTVHCGIPYIQNRRQEGKFFSLNLVVPYHRDAYEA